MGVYSLLKNVIETHRRREVMMLLVILPPLAIFLLYENILEIRRGEVNRELIDIQVEEVVRSSNKGSYIKFTLGGGEEYLFFRCQLSIGSKAEVEKYSYENGEIIYHSTECRF